jgi:putative transposase
MDFVRDTRADGRPFRALTLVDACTRECPVIDVDVSLGGARVVEVLDRRSVTCFEGLPKCIGLARTSTLSFERSPSWRLP